MNSAKEVMKYPTQTSVLLVFTLLDKFAYYGLSSIMFTYLKNIINYSPERVKLILNMFHVVAEAFTILGAIVADCWVGKYRTIVLFTLINICGLVIISLTAIESFGLSSIVPCYIGLFLIALGRGSIQSSLMAFGGDQFTLPQQRKQIDIHFHLYFFFGFLGIFGQSLTVKKIAKLRCYGYKTCHSGGFGITASAVATVFIIFLIGKRYFKITKPETNIFVSWINCVGHAIKQKIKSSENVENWLDRSVEKYGKKFVHHVKTNFRILPVYILLIFYAALDSLRVYITEIQENFMATNVDPRNVQEGHMGIIIFVIPLLLIPLFCGVIYPICARCNLLTTLLQRIGCGIMFSGIGFFIAGFLSIYIESNIASLPSITECHLRIYNPLNCTIKLNASPYVDNVEIASMDYHFINVPKLEEINVVDYQITGCENLISNISGDDFAVIQGKSISYFVSTRGFMSFLDNIPEYSHDPPKLRTLVGNPDERLIKWNITRMVRVLHSKSADYSLYNIKPGLDVMDDGKTLINFRRGEIYIVLKFLRNGRIKKLKIYEITKRDKPYTHWQLPQTIFFLAGQIMVYVNSFEFAYTQAPVHMKTLMITFFMWTMQFGTYLDNIFQLMPEFDNQSDAFFICSGFMLVIMGGFAFFAKKYKYVEDYNDEDIQENEEITLK